MHIIILGDSWGEPNWRSPQEGFTEQGHVSSRLRALGHKVTNFSQSGGSNLNTWLNWEQKLADTAAADWVIWFHTDVSRDWPWHELEWGWSYQELVDHTADRVYSRCRDIYARTDQAPIILVEGQSCRHEPYFSQYFQPQHVITDWRSELLGRIMPPTQLIGPISAGGYNFFRYCRDSLAEQNRHIDRVEIIMAAMKDSTLFPDNCHPGDRAHGQLLDKLTKLFDPKTQS